MKILIRLIRSIIRKLTAKRIPYRFDNRHIPEWMDFD